jgi:alcohol dehydrogenase
VFTPTRRCSPCAKALSGPVAPKSAVACGSGITALPDIHAGLADQTIVTTLCPGGKERMARLMRLVKAQRINLQPLLTHVFALDGILEAYHLFESRQRGVLKVAIRVS